MQRTGVCMYEGQQEGWCRRFKGRVRGVEIRKETVGLDRGALNN